MNFDDKEQVLINEYKNRFENRMFDEFDVLGFLIVIRDHLDKNKYKYILDFAHLIAHRKGRNRGLAMENIRKAIQNQYKTLQDGKTVKDYDGICASDWKNEWENLGYDINIAFDDAIIREITLCVCSLAQFSNYCCAPLSLTCNYLP